MKALVIQGGGFRTGFSAGVLQAFLEKAYNPFDIYVGVSGGAIAMSYYLANQSNGCIDAMLELTDGDQFLNFKNIFSSKPLIDVDFFQKIADQLVPFQVDQAIEAIQCKTIGIVMTDAETGQPYYHRPDKENWIDALIASSSMPMVTKGPHRVNQKSYLDGAWSDALPIQWAIDQGATEVLIIRTTPLTEREQLSWLDHIGHYLHWRDKKIQQIFKNNHRIFNQALDFIESAPVDIRIQQIAPDKALAAQQHSKYSKLIKKDFDFGVQKGMAFLRKYELLLQ